MAITINCKAFTLVSTPSSKCYVTLQITRLQINVMTVSTSSFVLTTSHTVCVTVGATHHDAQAVSFRTNVGLSVSLWPPITYVQENTMNHIALDYKDV